MSILDSHMAPYSACEVPQSTARSMHNSRQSDFERDCEGNTKVLSNTKKLARAMNFHALKSFEAYPTNHFEHPVAAEHTKAMISGRMAKKTTLRLRSRMLSKYHEHSRATTSSAKWLRSTAEQ